MLFNLFYQIYCTHLYKEPKRETPGSTPVSLVASVNEALEMIFEEGLENVYHRHAVVSQTIKNSLQAMGLTLLPEGDVDRSHSVTVFKFPNGIKPATIREMARDKYGILILMAAGHFEFNETAMRIGHLGLITAREALLVISALEVILFELGAVDKPGRGLEAYHSTLKSAGW
jgi:alanine-glyoxylate transaminase/serine-glyoxylate transaminase/serine-pyruvate transaminase